jgi:hypothetical protein
VFGSATLVLIFGVFLSIVFIATKFLPDATPIPTRIVHLAWGISAMVNWSVGSALNRRGWNHTLYGIPMQFWSAIPVTILVLMLVYDK